MQNESFWQTAQKSVRLYQDWPSGWWPRPGGQLIDSNQASNLRAGAPGTAMARMSFSTHTANRLGLGVGGYQGETALSAGYSPALSPRASLTYGAGTSGSAASRAGRRLRWVEWRRWQGASATSATNRRPGRRFCLTGWCATN